MAKPIFIIKYPVSQHESLRAGFKDITSKMPDYHVLFVPNSIDEIKFQCFNSEKANEIDFQLLQEKVLRIVEEIKK